ncbi:hypothetical protein OESDEN_22622, partial [Oesophagostomum dentatum]
MLAVCEVSDAQTLFDHFKGSMAEHFVLRGYTQLEGETLAYFDISDRLALLSSNLSERVAVPAQLRPEIPPFEINHEGHAAKGAQLYDCLNGNQKEAASRIMMSLNSTYLSCTSLIDLILALHQAGHSIHFIASQLERSRHAVSNLLNNPDSYGQRTSPERPRVISKREERQILREVSNTTISVGQIRANLNLVTSKTTVWRVINASRNIQREAMRKAP